MAVSIEDAITEAVRDAIARTDWAEAQREPLGPYMRLRDAAEYLGVSEKTLRRLDIPSYRHGAQLVLYRVRDIDEWVRSHAAESGEEE